MTKTTVCSLAVLKKNLIWNLKLYSQKTENMHLSIYVKGSHSSVFQRSCVFSTWSINTWETNLQFPWYREENSLKECQCKLWKSQKQYECTKRCGSRRSWKDNCNDKSIGDDFLGVSSCLGEKEPGNRFDVVSTTIFDQQCKTWRRMSRIPDS